MFIFKLTILISLQFSISIKCEDTPSVIIIGAGSAGIAAATKLYQNNIKNVKILEAENRTGGRIHSEKFGDAVVDLGAEWCDGGDSIAVYDTIKKLDLVELTDFSKTFYHSSAKYIDQELSQELRTIFEEIYYVPIEAEEGVTLEQYVINKYSPAVIEKYKYNISKFEFALDFLDIFRKEILIIEEPFSWNDLSAKSDHQEFGDAEGLNWKGRGFKTLLDVLLQKYPEPNKELPLDIILNKEVKTIFWNDAQPTVECSDGSTYKADHVISTVSLGVLKDRYQTLFNPELPEDKKNAIQKLGIGAAVKIFFYFSTKWWPEKNFKTIDLFWTKNDQEEFLKQQGEDKSWLLDLTGFYPVPKNPNVLEAWFVGTTVPQIELLPEDQIIEGTMLILNKFLGNHFKDIKKPSKILRSNWYSNPHFRGTCSYQTIQSRKRNVSAETMLSQPLTGKNGKMTLLFAGEATNPTSYATVHGALETGYREAQRLIDLYNSV